jgi:hypothetical protein
MTTAEGVFPKVGNDPIYGSEVNRFAGYTLYNAGSFVTGGSSTNLVLLGSIYFPTGALTNPSIVHTNIVFDNRNIGTKVIALKVSGATFGVGITGTDTTAVSDELRICVGSDVQVGTQAIHLFQADEGNVKADVGANPITCPFSIIVSASHNSSSNSGTTLLYTTKIDSFGY